MCYVTLVQFLSVTFSILDINDVCYVTLVQFLSVTFSVSIHDVCYVTLVQFLSVTFSLSQVYTMCVMLRLFSFCNILCLYTRYFFLLRLFSFFL